MESLKPDNILLQEIKLGKQGFPADFDIAGYEKYYKASHRLGHSGLAIYSKIEPKNVTFGMGHSGLDHEARVCTIEFSTFFLVSIYSPYSGNLLERAEERKAFDEALIEHVRKLNAIKSVITGGDFNLAHRNIDIYDMERQEQTLRYGTVAGMSDDERLQFSELLNVGLVDTFRERKPLTRQYTSFSSKANRKYNHGWRLNCFLVSQDLKTSVKTSDIISGPISSDHQPILLKIRLQL